MCQRISVRVALSLFVVMVSVVTAIVSFTPSFIEGINRARSHSESLAVAVSDLHAASVQGHFTGAERLASVMRITIRDSLGLARAAQLTDYTKFTSVVRPAMVSHLCNVILALNDSLTSVYVGHEDNEFFGCGRDSEGFLRHFIRDPQNQTLTLHRFSPSPDGTLTFVDSVSTTRKFNPRERPWYIAVEGKKEMTWAALYPNFDAELNRSASVAATLSFPLFNSSNDMYGVFSIDITTFQASNALQQPGRHGTYVVFQSPDSIVLAHSVSGLEVLSPSADLLALKDLQIPNVQLALAHMASVGINISTLTDTVALSFGRGGSTSLGNVLFVRVVPIKLKFGLRLNVLAILDEADFVGYLKESRVRVIIIASATALALALISALLATILFGRPLSALAERLNLTSAFNQEEPVSDFSRLSEIRQIQEAYVRLTRELFMLRSFIPMSLLKTVGDDEDDAAGGGLTVHGVGPQATAGTGVAAPTATRRGAGSPGHRETMVDHSPNNKDSGEKDSDLSSITTYTLTQSRSETPLEVIEVVPTPRGRLIRGITPCHDLVRQPVTLVYVNIRQFNNFSISVAPMDFAKAHTVLTDAIVSIVENHRGLVDQFNGDHFIISFNTHQRASTHKALAVRCALAILNEIRGNLSFASGMSCGIASGIATVGNIGCHRMTRYCVVGDVATTASKLEQVCNGYGPEYQILSTYKVVEDFSRELFFEAVDLMELRSEKHIIVSPKVFHEERDVEWMYDLDTSEKEHPYQMLNNGYFEFERKNYAQCNTILADIQKNYPTIADAPGVKNLKGLLLSQRNPS